MYDGCIKTIGILAVSMVGNIILYLLLYNFKILITFHYNNKDSTSFVDKDCFRWKHHNQIYLVYCLLYVLRPHLSIYPKCVQDQIKFSDKLVSNQSFATQLKRLYFRAVLCMWYGDEQSVDSAFPIPHKNESECILLLAIYWWLVIVETHVVLLACTGWLTVPARITEMSNRGSLRENKLNV